MLYSGSSPPPHTNVIKNSLKRKKNHMNETQRKEKHPKTTNNRSNQHGQPSFPKMLMFCVQLVVAIRAAHADTYRDRQSNLLSLHNLERGQISGEEDQVSSCSTLLLGRHESPSRQKLVLFPCLFLPLVFFSSFDPQMRSNMMYNVSSRRSHHQNSAHAHERVTEKCFCQEH